MREAVIWHAVVYRARIVSVHFLCVVSPWVPPERGVAPSIVPSCVAVRGRWGVWWDVVVSCGMLRCIALKRWSRVG